MRRLLALDMDGVMNKGPSFGGGIDRDKMWLLAEIRRRTGCCVLITSSWRKTPAQLRRMLDMLEELKIPLAGMTPVLDVQLASGLFTSQERSVEIATWLRKEAGNVLSLCILDDEPLKAPLVYHQIKTETEEGLTAARMEAACDMLLEVKFRSETLDVIGRKETFKDSEL